MNQAEAKITHHHSVCPLDCADTCSLTLDVRNGQVEKVRGSNANPFTKGKICAKVAQGLPAQVHGPGRITTPLLRDGSKGSGLFRPVSWDAALDIIHEKFSAIIADHGSEAIAPLRYGGPMGLLAGRSMDRRFFHRLGASKVDATPLCAGVSGAAWESVFGEAGGIPFTELAHSRLIVVWGNNITACNLHLTTLIRKARDQGAKLVVIDPKRTRIARDADLHLPLLPGTDVVLGYATAAELRRQGGLDQAFIDKHVHGAEAYLREAENYSLERAAQLCGLAADDIRLFAQWWAQLSPAAMSVGVAPERNRNGGSGLRAAFALPALTGNFGQIGAGVCDTSGYFPVADEQLARPDLLPRKVREFNVLDLPRHIIDPGEQLPLKAVFIYNHNPVAVHPRQREMVQALLSEDLFVVGSDVSMTDSMAFADVILPASSHLEYGDLYTAYGHHYLQRSTPVIEPVGESMSNMDIFRRLAQRFGFEDDCFSDTDSDLMNQAIPEEVIAFAGCSASELPIDQATDMQQLESADLLRNLSLTTPSGRIELFSEQLKNSGGDALPRFRELPGRGQFILVSPASERRTNSTFGGVAGHDSDMLCEMNPEDAADQGFIDGQLVRLHNTQGEVDLRLLITRDIRPGTLYVPKGAWRSQSSNGQTINALIPGHKADMAGGACYYDCQVDVCAAV